MKNEFKIILLLILSIFGCDNNEVSNNEEIVSKSYYHNDLYNGPRLEKVNIHNSDYLGSVNLNEIETIESFEYSLDNKDNEQLSRYYCEYVFSFIAKSEYTSLSILNNNSNYITSYYQFDSFDFEVFNSNGKRILPSRQQYNGEGKYIFQTTIDSNHYISIRPIKTILNNIEYQSEVISFKLESYSDTNNSSENAESLVLGTTITNFFNGGFDTDYYNIDLVEGKRYLIHPSSNIKISTHTNEIVNIIPYSKDVVFEAPITGEYTIIKSQNDDDPVSDYEITIFDFDSIKTIEPSNSKIKSEIINKSLFYKVNIDPKKEYILSWEDNDYVGIDYSANVNVYFTSINNRGHSILEYNSPYGKNFPIYLDFESNVLSGIIRFSVPGLSHFGNFSFTFEEDLTKKNYQMVSLNTLTECYSNNGNTQYYKFIIDQSKEYIINYYSKDYTNNSEYDGFCDLSIYTPDKSDYFIRNDSFIGEYNNRITFSDKKSNNNELILKVSFSHGEKVAFELTEITQ